MFKNQSVVYYYLVEVNEPHTNATMKSTQSDAVGVFTNSGVGVVVFFMSFLLFFILNTSLYMIVYALLHENIQRGITQRMVKRRTYG